MIMTFDRKWLTKENLNFGGPLIPWAYDARTTGANDTIATVNNSGYMNGAYNDLKVGQTVRVIDNTGAIASLIVVTNSYNPTLGTGAVDLADGMVVAATNTD